jgi:hypothetical protein
MFAGAGLMHHLGWAASPAGVAPGGWLALTAGYALALGIAWAFTFARVAARSGACDV